MILLLFSTATSLYTPPKTGSDLAVINLSPTPNESMQAPCSKTSLIICSSNELDTIILQSGYPAASKAFLHFFVK